MIENAMRAQGLSLAEAADQTRLALGPGGEERVDGAVREMQEIARRNQLLRVPPGVSSLEYRTILGEARGLHWYTGPASGRNNWNGLYEAMAASGSLDSEAIRSIDESSTKIVAHLPDPGIAGLRKKGLVVGFVQSGKTANYAAVIAKAADAGFRLFIVLAGIHNGLRQQTQLRLERDVIHPHSEPWVQLTQADKDFGAVASGPGLLSARELRNLAVVKKNHSRLRRLKEWLEAIPAPVRQRCPVLIIDDEADQATPNTAAARDEVSKINQSLRDVVSLLPTGAYVGYTATPFANVFLDPRDEEEFYPSDFIIDLERPKRYFGAEELFGSDEVREDGTENDGHDMVRRISLAEADAVRPPSNKEERADFDPPVPESLRTALKWFLLATAARRAREGQSRHSSMLVHTSQYINQHNAMAGRLRVEIDNLKASMEPDQRSALLSELERMWAEESTAVDPAEWNLAPVGFREVSNELVGVLDDVRVVEDHSKSTDRINYSEGIQTIIAVGGNTLSRGLTLEGLIVSYFCRSVATYDTLLQMGRWFGFRPGYEDLPRIWTTSELESRFRFLSDMERDMRREIQRYEEESLTPSQLGLRIRSHPNMGITAANKMGLARVVKFSYGGRRFQTFRFTRSDSSVLNSNLQATRRLILDASEVSGRSPEKAGGNRWVFKDIDKSLICRFLQEYEIHRDHQQLQPGPVLDYLEGRDDPCAQYWNVAIVGSGSTELNIAGERFVPGSVDLDLPEPVPMVNRARLKGSDEPADIKALMSRRDRFVDLELASSDWKDLKEEHELEKLRRSHSDGRGLLLLYPISPTSRPTGAALRADSRVPFDAPDDVEAVIGIGIIFPDPPPGGDNREELEYMGLPVSLFETDLYDEEEIQLLREDGEESAEIDGSGYLERVE